MNKDRYPETERPKYVPETTCQLRTYGDPRPDGGDTVPQNTAASPPVSGAADQETPQERFRKALGQVIRDPDGLLIFLHGFLGCGAEWHDALDILRGQVRCALVAPDLPGHGTCSLPVTRDFRLEDAVPALSACSNCVIWGYSMGGRIAMMTAARMLDQADSRGGICRIRGLVIESAHPGLTDSYTRQLRHENDSRWAQKFEEEQPEDVLSQWYMQPVFSSLTSEQKRLLTAEKLFTDGSRPAAALRTFSLGSQKDLAPVLQRLPTLYLYGTGDSRFTSVAEEIRTRAPGAWIMPVDGGSHNLHRFRLREILHLAGLPLPENTSRIQSGSTAGTVPGSAGKTDIRDADTSASAEPVE